jgi:hypothetical protein
MVCSRTAGDLRPHSVCNQIEPSTSAHGVATRSGRAGARRLAHPSGRRFPAVMARRGKLLAGRTYRMTPSFAKTKAQMSSVSSQYRLLAASKLPVRAPSTPSRWPRIGDFRAETTPGKSGNARNTAFNNSQRRLNHLPFNVRVRVNVRNPKRGNFGVGHDDLKRGR